MFYIFCQSALRISRDLTYHWWKDRSKKRVRNKNRVQHSPLLFGGSGPAIYEFSYFGSSSVCFATDYWLTVNFRYIFTKKRCTTPKKNRENKKKIRSKVGTQTFPGSPESDQPKWILRIPYLFPSSFSRHVRHFVWSFWTSRILVFQQGRGWLSLISRRRLSSTTYHPPLEAGGPSQQGFDGRFFKQGFPWDFMGVQDVSTRPKLAKNYISIICSGLGVILGRRQPFFSSMAGAWREKREPTTSDP